MYSEYQKRLFVLINRFGRQKFRMRLLQVSQAEFMMLGAIWRGTIVNLEAQEEAGGKNEAKENRGIQVSELIQALGSSKSATSKMLRTLEEKGYIERVLSRKDKRQIYITLTEYGEKMLKAVQKTMNGIARKVGEQMGEEDLERLIVLLERLAAIVEGEMAILNEKTERDEDIV